MNLCVIRPKIMQKEITRWPSPGARNPDFDREALHALQREEVAMVKADIECEDKYTADVEDKVLAEYEREFRDQHADLLSRVPRP